MPSTSHSILGARSQAGRLVHDAGKIYTPFTCFGRLGAPWPVAFKVVVSSSLLRYDKLTSSVRHRLGFVCRVVVEFHGVVSEDSVMWVGFLCVQYIVHRD